MADCDEIICLSSDDSLDSVPVTNTRQVVRKQINPVRHFSYVSSTGQSTPGNTIFQTLDEKLAENLARKFSYLPNISLKKVHSGDILQNKSNTVSPTKPNNNFVHVPTVTQNTTNTFVRQPCVSDKRLSTPNLLEPIVPQNTTNNFRSFSSASNKRQLGPREPAQNTQLPILPQNTLLSIVSPNSQLQIVAQNTTGNFGRNSSAADKRQVAAREIVQNIQVPQNTQLQCVAQTAASNFGRNSSAADKRQVATRKIVQNIQVPIVPQNSHFGRNYSSASPKNKGLPIVAPNSFNNCVVNYSSASDKRQSTSREAPQNLPGSNAPQNTTNNFVPNYSSTGQRQSTSKETVQNIRVPIEKRQSTEVIKAMHNTSTTNGRFEFPVAERPLAWSKSTSNFIKQSMNSAIKPGNKQMLLPTPPTAHQSSYPQLSTACAANFTQNNGMAFVSTQNVSSNYNTFHTIPYINVNPIHFEQGYYDQGILRNNFVPNISNNNNDFWLKVMLEDLPNRGEVVSQYYFDHPTQTPVLIRNNPQQISVLQTLDNNNETTNKKNIVANHNIQAVNYNPPEVNNNLKKGKNVVPPFLKRNRSVPLTSITPPKAADISSQNPAELSEEDEVIFVSSSSPLCKSASSQESSVKKPELITNKLIDNTKNRNSCKNAISNIITIDPDEPSSPPPKRLKKNVPAPRRNPKRQVQIEKDYMKMLVDSVWEPEKENKGRRLATRGLRDKKVEKKTAKRSPRTQPTCGAIFSPPSPLTASHIRKWPTDGMHERPEYNSETGKVDKFDQLIRQIANEYDETHKEEYTSIRTDIKDIEIGKDVPLSVLSHDVLHHVLSYVATTEKLKKDLKKSENSSDKTNVLDDKIQFLEDLKLVPTLNNTEDSCDTVNNNTNLVDQNIDEFSVKDLLKNNILLYCLTNNVDQTDVADYIEGLNPEDIIHFSNRKLGLEPDFDEDR